MIKNKAERQIQALEAKVAALEDRQKMTGNAVKRDGEAMRKITNKVNAEHIALTKRLNRLEPHNVEDYLDSLEDKVRDWNRTMQTMILRMTVLTEVVYWVRLESPEHAPGLTQNILKLFDKPDAWWQSQRDMSITGWIKMLGDRK